MKWDCKDFISIFSDVYPSGFCDHVIKEFNRNQSLGAGSTRLVEGEDKHEVDDFHIFANGQIMEFHWFEEEGEGEYHQTLTEEEKVRHTEYSNLNKKIIHLAYNQNESGFITLKDLSLKEKKELDSLRNIEEKLLKVLPKRYPDASCYIDSNE